MQKRKRVASAGARRNVVFGPGRRPDGHDGNRWITPHWLVERIREALGGTIGMDPCTEPENPTGARVRYTIADDGLKKPWRARRIYINPPYGDVKPWIDRAIRAARGGAKVYMLLPVRTDAPYHQDLLDAATDVVFIRGRLQFGRPNAVATGSAAFCSMIVGLGTSCAPLADLGILYTRVRKTMKRTKQKVIRGRWTRITPRVADLFHDRRTPPTTSGKQFPIFLGSAVTGLMLYIALNPGCTYREMAEYFEAPKIRLKRKIGRLLRQRLIVGTESWKYQINPGLECWYKLAEFLREHGRALGMPESRGRIHTRRPNVPVRAKIPKDLFWTSTRTDILVLVAILGETYQRELAACLRKRRPHFGYRLEDLAAEGLLSRRKEGRLVRYSLNDAFPGMKHLETFLRMLALRRGDLISIANSVLVRREFVRAQGSARERRLLDSIKLPANYKSCVNGVTKEIGRRMWWAMTGTHARDARRERRAR